MATSSWGETWPATGESSAGTSRHSIRYWPWRFARKRNRVASVEHSFNQKPAIKRNGMLDPAPSYVVRGNQRSQLGERKPEHRPMFVKTTISLLFIVSTAVVVSAVITWHISLTATNDAFDSMSETLRHDVMESSAHTVKDFLAALSLDSMNVFKCLEMLPNMSRADMSTSVLRCMWPTVGGDINICSTYVVNEQGSFASYRRCGPEARLLNTTIAVGIPSPPSDLTAVTWVYPADGNSGVPVTDGPMAKLCVIGSCPATAASSSNWSASSGVLWGTPLPPLGRVPAWLTSARLAHGQSLLLANMGLVGNWQPMVLLVRALRDPVNNSLRAAMAITYQASTVINYLLNLPVVTAMHGVAYITTGGALDLVSATHGSLVSQPVWADAMPPPYLPATRSDDVVVRTSSRHMNATFGALLSRQACEAVVHVPGRGRHYVNAQPLVQQELALTIFLAVPVGAFRDGIDDSMDRSLAYTLATVLAIFVLGCAGILLATAIMRRTYARVAEQNQLLQLELEELAASQHSIDWSHLDMGTASEKLHAMIHSLQGGTWVSQEQAATMLELLGSEDMHMPQFLCGMKGAGSPHGLDHETGAWLANLAERGSLHKTATPRGLSGSATATACPKSMRSLQSMKSVNHRAADELMVAQGLVASSAMSAQPALVDIMPIEEEEDEVTRQQLQILDDVTQALLSPRLRQLSSPGELTMHWSGTRDDLAWATRSVARIIVRDPLPTLHVAGLIRTMSLSDLSLTGSGSPRQQPRDDHEQGRAGVGSHAGSRRDGTGSPTKQGSLPMLLSNCSSPGSRHKGILEPLCKLGSWEMDTLAVSRACEGRPITFVGYLALAGAGLVREFGLPRDQLVRFLAGLDRGMDPLALYHSAAHIADVTGCLYHLLAESGMAQHLRRVDVLAALCAGLVHDYKHPGVNNNFIQKMGGELAMRYNDRSPLENFHLSQAFELLTADGCNFLEHLGRATYAEIRHIIIEMVLATDLQRHFGELNAFKTRMMALGEKPWDPESESDRLLLLRMALKVADLGHTCKSLPLHQRWTSLIVEEFYTQGDAEKEAQVEVSPFMDRKVYDVPKAQAGFFHFLVLPMVDAWVKAFPRCAPLLANLTKNAEYWKQEQKRQGPLDGATEATAE